MLHCQLWFQFDFIFDGFEHGYAPIMYNDEKKAWLSRDGRIIEKDPYCSRPVQENRFWVKEGSKSNYWHLEDDDGHLLSLDYELDIVNEFYFFSDGFVCVRNKEGLCGYLDENGQEVIPADNGFMMVCLKVLVLLSCIFPCLMILE